LFGFEDSVVDNLFIILQERSWASAEIFPWGDNIDISLIVFQIGNDAV